MKTVRLHITVDVELDDHFAETYNDALDLAEVAQGAAIDRLRRFTSVRHAVPVSVGADDTLRLS